MEGLPFLFVVTNISQMSLDLCWFLTLLPPSLFLTLFSASPSLYLPSCLSLLCLSLLLTLSSLPLLCLASISLLRLSPHLSLHLSPTLSPCLSVSLSQSCGSCRSSSCLTCPSAACRAPTFTSSCGKGTGHLLTSLLGNWIISLIIHVWKNTQVISWVLM